VRLAALDLREISEEGGSVGPGLDPEIYKIYAFHLNS